MYPVVSVRDKDQCVMLVWFHGTKSMGLDQPQLRYIIGGRDKEACQTALRLIIGKSLEDALSYRHVAQYTYSVPQDSTKHE